jgi:hypothetical protein
MIDYIKLARQAGIDVLEVESERASMWPATPEGLAKFAELVLEAERERWARQLDALGCDHCAAAIRTRKPNAEGKRPAQGADAVPV